MGNLVEVAQAWLWEQSDRYREVNGKDLLNPLQAFSLSPDQSVVIYQLCTQEYEAAFLTGAAGTGKSYTVSLVKELMELQGYAVYRTASTGVAAQQINGWTVHSLLKLGSFDVVPLGEWEDNNCCQDTGPRRTVQQTAFMAHLKPGRKPVYLIVDEISMLTSEQLVLIYQTARQTQALTKQRVRFLLVGDLRQLAPVEGKCFYPAHNHPCYEDAVFTLRQAPEKQVFYGSFFSTGPFPKKNLAVKEASNWRFLSYSLYTQHRQCQNNREFNEALHYLGRGCGLDHPAVSYLKERIYLPYREGSWRNASGHIIRPDEHLIEATHLFMRNGNKTKGQQNRWHWKNTVGEHNEKITERLRESHARRYTYTAKIEPGLWTEEEIIDYFRPIPRVITLYEGMRFLCRYNYRPGLANGTMARITRLYPDRIEVEVIETGESFTLTETELPLPRIKDKVPGVFRTCAFGQVGNAMTYWASQGMTLKRKPDAKQGEDCLVVHLERRSKVQGLFYVACSRVQEAEQLFILADSYKQVDDFIYCDPDVLKIMDRAEAETRSLTGEAKDEEPLICRLQDSWETNTGFACMFQTGLPDLPKLVIFYDNEGNRLGVSQRADRLIPVQVDERVIQECEALL